MFDRSEITRVVSLMLTWQCNLNCVYCFEKYKSSNKVMSFEMAQNIIRKEMCMVTGNYSKIKIEFFGGEPLLNFSLIKSITEWMVSEKFDVDYELSVTTNGTLLDDIKMEWFRTYKDYIIIVMSVDGDEQMQISNRGIHSNNIPINFVRDTWPKIHFKSTISRANLNSLSSSIIALLERGFVVAPSLAVGEEWMDGDEVIYKTELEKLADWCLEHIDKEPMKIFLQPFFCLLEPHFSNPPQKNCGTGTTMATYDIDGKCYPCHLFVPITHGNFDVLEEMSNIDFSSDKSLIDKSCSGCKILRICKTCYGFNYKDRHDITKRDKKACKMQLAEAQVVSSFQINYLVELSKQRRLIPSELYALQGALKCHELYGNFNFEELK